MVPVLVPTTDHSEKKTTDISSFDSLISDMAISTPYYVATYRQEEDSNYIS